MFLLKSGKTEQNQKPNKQTSKQKTPRETAWNFKLWNAFVFDIVECKRRVWIAVVPIVKIFPADFSETKLGFIGKLVD